MLLVGLVGSQENAGEERAQDLVQADLEGPYVEASLVAAVALVEEAPTLARPEKRYRP